MSYDNDWKKEFDPQSGRLVPKRASSCTVDSIVRLLQSPEWAQQFPTVEQYRSAVLNAIGQPNDWLHRPSEAGHTEKG